MTVNSWKLGLKALDDVLDEQSITLDVLMTAEMVKERAKSDKLSKFAEILRKPNEAMTADEVGFMNQRIVERHSNIQSGGSASGTKPASRGEVGNDVPKRWHRTRLLTRSVPRRMKVCLRASLHASSAHAFP